MQARTAVFVLLAASLLAGCARPPGTYDFEPVSVVDSDRDEVWQAALDFFIASGLPIHIADRETGLIVTDWMDATEFSVSELPESGEATPFCDCGTHMTVYWVRGKSTVLVGDAPGGEVELRVDCVYQARVDYGSPDSVYNVECPSTGHLEVLVESYVRAECLGETPDAVPILDLWEGKPLRASVRHSR